MLSTPQLPPPIPRRIDSLSNNVPTQPKLANPLVQSREDAKYARVVLTASVTKDEDKAEMQLDNKECVRRRQDDRTQELTNMLERMTDWVEELALLLQQSYKNQTELETALTLARSNLQLALANNEMLEEALKRGGGGGQDVGWRRWSEREGVRRSGSVKDCVHPDRPASVPDPPQQQLHQHQPQQSAPSRFFSFKSLQRISNSNTSPTATNPSPPYASASASVSTSSLLPAITIPSSSSGQSRAASPVPGTASITTPDPSSSRSSSPSLTHAIPAAHHSHSTSLSLSQPSQRTPREKELTSMLNKERAALKALADAKTQLEDELESLSQALFEEANKMVSMANRKLAETEEELRIATEQKEALRGALRIVEGENGALRRVGGNDYEVGVREEESTPRGGDKQLFMSGIEASPLDDVDKMDLSPQAPSQSRLTHPTLPLHLPVRTTTITDQRPATTGNKVPFWNPVTPLSDSGEGEGGVTQRSLSHYRISPSSPSSPASQPHVQAPSPTSPAHSANPNAPTPTSETQSAQAHPVATPVHRWSMLPATPRSRNAVRSEFEDAMRRMRELVGDGGEDEDEDEDEQGGGGGEGHAGDEEYFPEKESGEVEAKVIDGGVNPRGT